MDEIINKIKIEKFYYFEKRRYEPEMIIYYVVFTFRINDESKLNIERSFTGFNSDDISSKLFRAVLSYKAHEEIKNKYVKLMYEANSEDEFKKLHREFKDACAFIEYLNKEHERMLKGYMCARHYDYLKNEWYNIIN